MKEKIKVLVGVDLQNDFIDGSLANKEAQAVIDNIVEKIRNFDGDVMFFTLDTHFSDYLQTNEGKMLPVEHCLYGTEGWELNKKIVKGNVFCSDAFYEVDYDYKKRSADKNVLGIEMETFALFSNAKKFDKRATALLTVSDLFFSDDKLSSMEREKELNDMIILALESCLKL